MRGRCWILLGLLVLGSRATAADAGALARVLLDPAKNSDAKGDACVQLMELGPAAAPATGALIRLLGAREVLLRDFAISTLKRIGPAARPALPALRNTARLDESAEIRELAREAIVAIESPGARPAAPAPAASRAAPAPPRAAGRADHVNADGLPARPPLVVHQGRYFQWSVPIGWRESESTNGVTLTSPDGATSVSSVLLMRSVGSTAPADFAARMLSLDPNVRDLSALQVRNLPDQPSGIGAPWNVQEIDFRYTSQGVPVRATWTVGIASAFGRFDAFMLGYQAPAGTFDAVHLWLDPIARSVVVTNPRAVAGNDRLIPPRNHPLDNSGLLESWRQKGLSQDRISKATREGMMGYERTKDSAGNYYNMPLESWDGAAGGYRNPRQPGEILQRTNPGE